MRQEHKVIIPGGAREVYEWLTGQGLETDGQELNDGTRRLIMRGRMRGVGDGEVFYVSRKQLEDDRSGRVQVIMGEDQFRSFLEWLESCGRSEEEVTTLRENQRLRRRRFVVLTLTEDVFAAVYLKETNDKN